MIDGDTHLLVTGWKKWVGYTYTKHTQCRKLSISDPSTRSSCCHQTRITVRARRGRSLRSCQPRPVTNKHVRTLTNKLHGPLFEHRVCAGIFCVLHLANRTAHNDGPRFRNNGVPDSPTSVSGHITSYHDETRNKVQPFILAHQYRCEHTRRTTPRCTW